MKNMINFLKWLFGRTDKTKYETKGERKKRILSKFNGRTVKGEEIWFVGDSYFYLGPLKYGIDDIVINENRTVFVTGSRYSNVGIERVALRLHIREEQNSSIIQV